MYLHFIVESVLKMFYLKVYRKNISLFKGKFIGYEVYFSTVVILKMRLLVAPQFYVVMLS